MDTSLLSRQVALENATADLLSNQSIGSEAARQSDQNSLVWFGEAYFDTSGLEAFQAIVIPESTEAAQQAIDDLDAELAVARETLAQLKKSLLELKINDCQYQPFFQGLRPTLEEDLNSPPSRREQRAVQQCLETRQTQILQYEAAITTKEAEITEIEVGLEVAKDSARAGASAHADLISARMAAAELALQQRGLASKTALIAMATFGAATMTMLFTPVGGSVLGLTFGLLVVGLAIPVNAFSVSTGGFLFIFANAIAALSILLALHAFRLFVLHNAELWRLLSLSERRRVGLKTLAYWSIPAVFLAAGIVGSKALDDWAMDQLYRDHYQDSLSGSECQSNGRILATAPGKEGTCIRRRLEADVQRAIRTQFGVARLNALQSIDELTDETLSSADWARTTAKQVVDDALPDQLAESMCRPDSGCTYVSPLFNIQTGCDFWRVGCHVRNAGKHAARRGYDNMRARTIDAVENTLQAAGEIAEGSAESVRSEAQGAVNETVSASILALDRFSWSWFRAHDVIRFIAIFCLSLAVLKSIGYVTIRVIHHQPGFNERLSAGPSESEAVSSDLRDGKVIISGNSRLSLPVGDTFCIASSVAVQRHQSHLALPIPSLGLFIWRAFAAIGNRKDANAWFSHFRTTVGGEDFSISTDEGRRLVAVRLELGEALAFEPASFVGRSSTVRLRRRWGFRATDLMAGRIRRPHAYGPGFAIFRTAGDVEVACPNTPDNSGRLIEVSRLVAWTPGIPYRLASREGLGAMYLGTTDVGPARNGLALGDGGRGARVASGAVRAVLLLLPV
ncbi:hypothetical protein ACFORG_12250 [Lutimaribacter marinistellae]|uniref:Uncharacterized protein n=1 Tax=Lutimaribacter marinistellae TaxID=1820329 RepID=A0ABV7TI05_9RHOB